MRICKSDSYSAESVTNIFLDTTFSNIVFIAYQTSANKIPIVTAFGISITITTCFKILSLFNTVLIFKIAFTSSALILFPNFNFTTFIWQNTCSISASELGIGYTQCLEQNQPVFCMCFLRWHLHTNKFSPICYCVSNILQRDN